MSSEGIRPPPGQIKAWKKLAQAKHRRQEGRFLAEGGKVVTELLRSGRPLESLLVREEDQPRWASLLAGAPAEAAIYQLTAGEWGALSQDQAPEGVMAVAAIPPPAEPARLVEGPGPLLLLHQVNNPNNLGALLRTADWFGFRTVLLSEGSVEATNPKTVRTSMGSLFHLTVVEGLDFWAWLPRLRARFRILGSQVREGGDPRPCSGPAALLLGNESHGLPESLLALTDERWRIPGGGRAESLSLPQAAAIMMYECVRQGASGR
jgi:TrmH family RNA methyltransferase